MEAMGWKSGAPQTLTIQLIRSIHRPSQQVPYIMKGLGKGKKKPLGLPSTLQQELGLGLGGGGGGGGAKMGKRKKGAAPLSRKEVGAGWL